MLRLSTCIFFVIILSGLFSFQAKAFCHYSHLEPASEAIIKNEESEIDKQPYDPLEPINRKVFAINDKIAKHYNKKTLANKNKKYKKAPVLSALSNIFKNFSEINNSINHFLCRNPEAGFKAFWRFYINSTLGLFGMFDVAEDFDIPYEARSLEETLIKYNVKPGPYIYIPLWGPRTLRQFLAEHFEIFFHPSYFLTGNKTLTYILYSAPILINLNQNIGYYNLLINMGGSDQYATVRNLYFQSKNINPNLIT